ncbi:M56 family metallopeptidase [Bacillus wiedmannii]|uniref:M56 family metallopeptidase n=1 Tax=Bacillus wiedmannii TaxID=1890302 RepID=UPI000BF97285|nr:M56 family metallopeptidase [Bacillus wiedmannii]PFZ91296.1 methicillin resistance protein [Bacillus wiedmannii]
MLYTLLNLYLPRIFDWLLQTTIMASISVGLILCVKVVLRNKLTPRWQYTLWLILVVRLLLPWSPDSSYSIYSLLSSKYEASYLGTQAEMQVLDSNIVKSNTTNLKTANESTNGMNDQGTAQDPHHISMYQICLYVWLLGVFCLGMITLVVNNRVYAYIKKQPIVMDERISSIFEGCKNSMSIKREIPLLLAGKISSPTLLGFRKPRVLLCEKHIQHLDDNQLRFIFYHELAHFKRKDVGVNWLMHSSLILNWFNPILWYAYYAMREDQEMACDELALTFIGPEEKIEYGHTIITLLEHYSNYYQMPSLANLSRNKRALKRRIMMIKKFNKHSYRLSVLGLVAVLGVSTFSLVNAKTEEPISNKDRVQNVKSIKESKVKQEDNSHLLSEGKQKSEEVDPQIQYDKETKPFALRGESSGPRPIALRDGTPFVLKLTKKEKQSLIDKGLPTKQTPQESKSTNLVLVSLVESFANEEGTLVRPPHFAEMDVIRSDEYQKKYGKVHYTTFSAWE